MNCKKCGQEFTKEDKASHNWGEMMGDQYHICCPTDTCQICGKPITFQNSERMPGRPSQIRKHKTCKYQIAKRESTPADPTSWIAR